MLLAVGKPPQTLSITETQKTPPIEQWERNISTIDPLDLSQAILNNLPSESVRPSSKSPTKDPVMRHSTVAYAELSLNSVLHHTTSAPNIWSLTITASPSSDARGCNHSLGPRSISSPNSTLSYV
jgi:hypothetical protein